MESLDRWVGLLKEYLPQPWMQASVVVALAVVVGWIARTVISRVLVKLAARSKTDLDDKLIQILQGPIFSTFIVMGVLLAERIIDIPEGIKTLFINATLTFLIVIWLFALVSASSTVLAAFARVAGRVRWIQERTLPLLENIVRIGLFGLAIYMLLSIWNLDVAPWLASAGVVGLALGFAAKDTLANLFGGFFIIIDSPYQIGDYINLESGERGEVTRIGLRSTRLLTRDDIEITIPNAQIANAMIINEAGGKWEKSRIRIKVGVAYGSDVDQVEDVLLKAACSNNLAVAEPAPRVRFRALGESSLDFELLCWIETPVDRGRAVHEILKGVYNALNAAEIAIPFPQRQLHLPPTIRVDSRSN